MVAALYARVSTVKQAEKDLSIPDQLRQMRDWCKRNGYSVAKEYIEPGASATDDRRPQFQQMIADATIKPSPYETIIVHSLSRFFRDLIEFALYERRLNKVGVKVISITQQTSDDSAGEMARHHRLATRRKNLTCQRPRVRRNASSSTKPKRPWCGACSSCMTAA